MLEAAQDPAGVLALAKGLENEGSRSGASNRETGQSTSVLVEEPEAPEPTEQTLAALVENLEEQVSAGTAPAQEPHPPAEPPAPVDAAPEETALAVEPLAQLSDEQMIEAQVEDAAREWAIGAIVDSFRQQPRTLLLNAAWHDVHLSPGPLQSFCGWVKRPETKQPPEGSNRCPAPAPQPLLLPGPCLPSDLKNLRDNRRAAAEGKAGKTKFPSWSISLLVAMLLALAGGSFLQNVIASREQKASSVSPAEAASQSSAGDGAGESHPFARYVEVTGLRVVADSQRRAQLQYIVVNHSTAQLSGLALRIVVKSTSPASKAPLFQVAAVVPSLGPYEAKEIRTDLDTQLRPAEIPDWDHLKVDVQVTTR